MAVEESSVRRASRLRRRQSVHVYKTILHSRLVCPVASARAHAVVVAADATFHYCR